VTIRLGAAEVGGRLAPARRLIEEYAASLNVDLRFRTSRTSWSILQSEYAPVTGAFLLAEERGVYLGCVGVRQFSGRHGEIKRLYVPLREDAGRTSPGQRHRGCGQAAWIHPLLLDTLPSMKQAQSLPCLGFRPTATYRFNPVPGTAFLELDLR